MTIRVIDTERVIHAIKTAISCLIGYFINFFIMPANTSPWMIISIIVVMCAQLNVGSVLQRSYLRFMGTILGCLFASIALTFYGATPLSIIITLALSSFFFSYIATSKESLSYAGTLGAVTTAIIMLAHDTSLTIAGERSIEISLGILIATLVSQFVLPIHASSHLRRNQAETLKSLRAYYMDCMNMGNSVNVETASFQDVEENIVKSLTKQRQLAKEAKRDLLDKRYNPTHFLYTLYCEKELLRCIDFMHHALVRLSKVNTSFTNPPPLVAFNEMIIQSLTVLIKVLESNALPKETLILPTRADLSLCIPQKTLSLDETLYFNGFIFSGERLIECLQRLAVLFELPISPLQQIS